MTLKASCSYRAGCQRGRLPGMAAIGAPVRVHSMTGDDLGVAHVAPTVEPGDVICLGLEEFRIGDVVPALPGSWFAAMVRVQPVHRSLGAPADVGGRMVGVLTSFR